MCSRFDQQFYSPPALQVARSLLGQRLVRLFEGERLAGLITETEAYQGEEDLASHARAGLTPRTRIMYGPAGHAYVYFTYGMHWMLNVVCGPPGFPAAVLLRSIQPVEGLETIARRRAGQPPAEWTNGPAKICRALDVDVRHNGLALFDPSGELWVEPAPPPPPAWVRLTARIGIPNVPEPWRSMPWRFVLEPPT